MAATQKNKAMISLVKKSQSSAPWSEEFEKMISGMNFKVGLSPEIQAHRIIIKRHLNIFNDTSVPDDATIESLKERRMTAAKKMLGHVGENTNIEAPFTCVWGCNFFLGDESYVNRGLEIHDNAPIVIGNGGLIGPDVLLNTSTHSIDPVTGKISVIPHALPIFIEDGAWICARATINPGVTIGKGSVVAAGAVVTRDVGERFLVGGVPARVLRKLGRDEGLDRKEHGEAILENGEDDLGETVPWLAGLD